MTRSYSELIMLPTFKERFEYLKLDGKIGTDTFGFDRYLNQAFYKSALWQEIRREAIIRDNACDLAVEGFEIHEPIYIHHMNPISVEEVLDRSKEILDLEFLICTRRLTHNLIHYGGETDGLYELRVRRPNDTIPWK